ncbi:DUF4123 domain-containing protein [Pantoea sp. Tr-811]|uniref:DUF4123 domain-containing protein n=1 Tax=Pantoea sp. Tr-811 TaxID=2608361 RepID=UPI00141F1B45|nr:DUF4123 domain-containing protein [Pantoea sp. Tr-811]NIF25135.1 DUF4123 domain-containing protein [Pantoea sp. Tr-811]
MSTQAGTTWLNLLLSACEQAQTPYLHVIIDQAGFAFPIRHSVLSVDPPLDCYSLFTGLPEEGAEDLAPLLVRVELAQPLQKQWLLGLLNATNGLPVVLTLASAWPFPILAEHLGRCIEALNGGCLGLLRYYDPRLFPLLFSHVLTPEQQQAWLQPAVFWSWLDRDGMPQHLLGQAHSPVTDDPSTPIELSDSQVDVLCCASDATAAMASLAAAFPHDWGAEQRFRGCYSGMLAASSAGLLTTAQREAYTLDHLRQTVDSAPSSKSPLQAQEPHSCPR